jgi:hypothetical protein
VVHRIFEAASLSDRDRRRKVPQKVLNRYGL